MEKGKTTSSDAGSTGPGRAYSTRRFHPIACTWAIVMLKPRSSAPRLPAPRYSPLCYDQPLSPDKFYCLIYCRTSLKQNCRHRRLSVYLSPSLRDQAFPLAVWGRRHKLLEFDCSRNGRHGSSVYFVSGMPSEAIGATLSRNGRGRRYAGKSMERRRGSPTREAPNKRCHQKYKLA
ncbi:hypothetical protein J6590_029609 [Homalodisca vitripennis]|nr:hypothetical protein J6590_029609 [Homalodisca vitripennis]